ncbi:hypothetical protein CPB85DRAFT_1496578 [Mucidula mucida]|nr:hypothetical protein CPB85DRAFT_1496578 [Mucidula mucida]
MPHSKQDLVIFPFTTNNPKSETTETFYSNIRNRLNGRASKRARQIIETLRPSNSLDIEEVPSSAGEHGDIVVVHTTVEAAKVPSNVVSNRPGRREGRVHIKERANEASRNFCVGDLLVQEAEASGEVHTRVGHDGDCDSAGGRVNARADSDGSGRKLFRGLAYWRMKYSVNKTYGCCCRDCSKRKSDESGFREHFL